MIVVPAGDSMGRLNFTSPDCPLRRGYPLGRLVAVCSQRGLTALITGCGSEVPTAALLRACCHAGDASTEPR